MPHTHHESERPDHRERSCDGVAPAHHPRDQGDHPAPHHAAPEDMAHPRGGGCHAHLGEKMQGLRVQCFGSRCQKRKEKGAEDIRGQHNGPQAQRLPHVAPLGKNQRDGIEGVFSEQLSAAENYGQKAKRVEEQRYKLRPWRIAQGCTHHRNRQSREPHRQPAHDAGDGQRLDRAQQLAPRVPRNLLEDLVGGGPVQIALLRLGRRFFHFRLDFDVAQRHACLGRRRRARGWFAGHYFLPDCHRSAGAALLKTAAVIALPF